LPRNTYPNYPYPSLLKKKEEEQVSEKKLKTPSPKIGLTMPPFLHFYLLTFLASISSASRQRQEGKEKCRRREKKKKQSTKGESDTPLTPILTILAYYKPFRREKRKKKSFEKGKKKGREKGKRRGNRPCLFPLLSWYQESLSFEGEAGKKGEKKQREGKKKVANGVRAFVLNDNDFLVPGTEGPRGKGGKGGGKKKERKGNGPGIERSVEGFVLREGVADRREEKT